jgi:hypothetical protein
MKINVYGFIVEEEKGAKVVDRLEHWQSGNSGKRFMHKILITKETDHIEYSKTISFDFYNSMHHYNETMKKPGQSPELDEENLKHAFGCFLSDANLGFGTIDSYEEEFGEEPGARLWELLEDSARKAWHIGLDSDKTCDLINKINEEEI